MQGDPFLGQTLGKYQVLEKIGEGGMGVVYKGRQTSLNRSVAIKVLPRQMAIDRDFVQRFLQEAEVIARLTHENIVYVFDIDQHEGAYYIVMEYIDGHSLREYRGQPLAAEQVQAIGVPVARALDYAHQRGIVHRDVKSSNVMVTSERKIKLMDFGIAKSVGGGGVKTVTGSVLGTPEYMAPEQARGGSVTAQSDVYALGVLLYELAVGHLPFAAEDPFAMALKHISEPPVPPSQRQPSVPAWLDQVILRAMAKELADRYPSAAALEEELRRGGGGSLATPAFSAALSGDASPSTPTGPTVLPTSAPTAVAPPSPAPQVPLPAPPGAAAAGVTPSAGFPATGYPAAAATPATGYPAAGGAPTGAPLTPPPPPPAAPAAPPPVPGAHPVAMPTPTPTFAEQVVQAAPAPGYASQGGGAGVATPTPTPMGPAAPAASGRRLPLALAGGIFGLILVIVVGLMILRGREATPEPSSEVAAGTSTAGGSTTPSPTLRQTGEGEGAGAIELDEAQRQRLTNKLLLDQAEQHLEAGNIEEALRLIEQVLATDPQDQRALELRRRARQAAAPPPRPAPPSTTRPYVAPSRPEPQPPPAASATATAPRGPVSRASVSELWYEAEALEDREHYHSLKVKIEEVLAIDPHHEKANRWKYRVDDWIREQEADLRDEIDSYLEDFVDSIDGKDLDDIEELWNYRLDSGTSQYFRELFRKYPVIRATYTFSDVRVHDKSATFSAHIEIRAKQRRGPLVPYQPISTTNWNGGLDLNGPARFTRPFP